MKEGNVVQEKSYKFALDIVRLCSSLMGEKREFVLSKRLLKSGTSIGANVEEAIGAQTRKDFYSKLNVAYKEARETHYWLRLLRDAGPLEQIDTIKMLNECEELLKIIGSILKTLRSNQVFNS